MLLLLYGYYRMSCSTYFHYPYRFFLLPIIMMLALVVMLAILWWHLTNFTDFH